MWQFFNSNPIKNRTDDCAIRAISAAFDVSWDTAFDALASRAKQMGEVMHSDDVWGSLLRQYGYTKELIPDSCPEYTLRDFSEDHPKGVFIVKTSQHVVCVRDGVILDTFNSSDECPQYYWKRDRNKRR